MTSNKVMLFMKGSPDAPRCGFSRKIVELLREQGVPDFGHFDILEDENVRSGELSIHILSFLLLRVSHSFMEASKS